MVKGGGQGKSEGEIQYFSEGSGGGQARSRKKSNAARRLAVEAAAKIRASVKIQGAKRERVEAESRDKSEA